MRISKRFARVLPAFGLGIGLTVAPTPAFVPGLTPAVALDGRPADNDPPVAPPQSALDAFRSGAAAWRAGEKKRAVTAFQSAAQNGHFGALWQLGRIYANGDGVNRDDLKAFEYYMRIVNSPSAVNPDLPQAPLIASAFVALGHYYLDGIPDSAIKPDPERALDMFRHAALNFADRDAQYYLGRMYLDGRLSGMRDLRLAAKWFRLAAIKGQHQAQAILGRMLFKGEGGMERQGALGLMWLMRAKDAATPDEAWIVELYDAANKQASEDERAMAAEFSRRFVSGRRE